MRNEIVTHVDKLFRKLSILDRFRKVLCNVSKTVHVECPLLTILWIIKSTFYLFFLSEIKYKINKK